MKKYFIVRGDFGNVYSLYWADSTEMEKLLPEGAERISRKEAERLAAAENYRRKYTPSSSGYAASAIYPAGLRWDFCPEGDPRYQKRGYIWERIK